MYCIPKFNKMLVILFRPQCIYQMQQSPLCRDWRSIFQQRIFRVQLLLFNDLQSRTLWSLLWYSQCCPKLWNVRKSLWSFFCFEYMLFVSYKMISCHVILAINSFKLNWVKLQYNVYSRQWCRYCRYVVRKLGQMSKTYIINVCCLCLTVL